MRATRSSSVFPFLATRFPFVAIMLLAGCNPPSVTPDAAIADDAATPAVDGGHDSGPPRVDAGPIPICTGTGCNLVGIELLAASTCVLRENGQVDCWGRGQDGELGDGLRGHSDNCMRNVGEGMTDCARAAVTVALPGPAESISSRGSIQMCAILETSHEVWCWGAQTYKLGANLEHDRFAPEHLQVAAAPIADGATDLATSFSNVCWIAADTMVHCVGGGSSGRLGNAMFDDEATPQTALLPDGVTPITGALEVDTASGHTCARTASHLYCWGNNQNRQVGAPPPHQTCLSGVTPYDCSSIAVEVTGVTASTITSLQLGDNFTCVLHSTGHVQCWGGGQSGGLGTGDINATPDPVEPVGLTNVQELRVVDGNACALRQDGSVWCWGPGNVGQIGDGRMSHTTTPCIDSSGAPYDCQLTPVQLTSLSGVAHIGLGEGHACALTTTGEVWCWGESLRYQLGDAMRPMPQFTPVRATALGL